MAGEGWTSRLLVGLAGHLDAADVGTYRAADAYQPDETAIVIRGVPQAPDRLITLAPYPIGSATPGLADHQLAVQIRIRAGRDPRECDDLADAVFDLLDGASGLVFGGIAVVQIWRQSYTSLGDDSNGRWSRSENYYLDAMRPTSNNSN
ncbi:minor capsid protein [Micromonospora sp. NPDC003816]|uniref:minor capsid protein n=1 Tax=Micromonospora sp. NPDC003816 TaxID=3364224 RepID=UPI0036ADC76C